LARIAGQFFDCCFGTVHFVGIVDFGLGNRTAEKATGNWPLDGRSTMENKQLPQAISWTVEGWADFWKAPRIEVARKRVPLVCAKDIV
jgi:hypothetical protein